MYIVATNRDYLLLVPVSSCFVGLMKHPKSLMWSTTELKNNAAMEVDVDVENDSLSIL